ncbi:hypothetical protein ACOMHN_026324 [Nucella lapillus]
MSPSVMQYRSERLQAPDVYRIGPIQDVLSVQQTGRPIPHAVRPGQPDRHLIHPEGGVSSCRFDTSVSAEGQFAPVSASSCCLPGDVQSEDP